MKRTLLLALSTLVAGGALAAGLQSGPQKDQPAFRARVDEVVVYASVYDARSQLVADLTQDDFEVYEDRKLQKINSFVRTDVPSTMGLVLDASGSMRNKQESVEKAVELFLDLTNPRHQLFLISFDDEVELQENFTRDVEDIRDSVQNIIVKGGTAFYDAVFLAVDKAEQGEEPKKVVVVFTDGEDKDSYYGYEEILEKAREAETQVFIVAFLDADLDDSSGFFGLGSSERERVVEKVESLADVTGGKAFFPDNIGELSAAFEGIARELQNQYRIAYQSTNEVFDGSWRRVDVKVKNAGERNLKVRARRGYYARDESGPISGSTP